MARKQVKSVAGKVVAITGGARGIGRCTAQALVRRGARVAIGDLHVELAEKAAAELGGNAVAFELDVTDRDSFAAFLDEAEKELGPVDVVINNAGIMPIGPFVEESDETAKTMIDINLHGVIFGTKLALERMLPRGGGHIVNIASQAGKAGLPGGATYCATKHAVVGLSEAVRLENVDTGIEVSCVMPAVVNTELGGGLTETRGVKKVEPEEVAEAIVEAIETNRFDVWVPRSTAGISAILSLVPRSGREAIARLLKADKVLSEVDEQERAAYEERAAKSTSEAAAAADAEQPATKG
ncbi:MAG: SDR family oxidoreductase [Acidobacteria bacterium]|nr:MAG: SDR family oxidoreductase [Acidobacteriota bacterium]GIK78741.1 MAG: short-chain dehydrogenase [Actinomycetes bacterium]